MTLIVTILLGILLVLLILIGLILVMPIHYRAQGTVNNWTAQGFAQVRWAFGFLSVRVAPKRGVGLYLLGLKIVRFKAGHDKKQSKKKEKKKEKKAKQAKSKKGLGWFWNSRPALFKLFRRGFAKLHLCGHLEGTLGFDDPADTAWIWLFLNWMDARVSGFALQVDCAWQNQTLDLNGKIQGWIWPVQLLWFGIELLIRREYRRILRAA